VWTENANSDAPAHRTVFATTHWSVVLAAGEKTTARSTAALEQICRTYWHPLYAYVRCRGHSPEDAKDLTQEFFFRLVQKDYLAQVDPRRGKFRSFLLAAMNHFLAKEWARGRTLKRGGRITFVPLDEAQAEQRYQAEFAGTRSPEEIFDRAWAIALLGKVMARLREETAVAGHAGRFEELKGVLMGERPSLSYAELAPRLRTTEAALKMTVRRLRNRYAELLREEIANTVPGPQEAEDELRHLRAVLSSRG
jgi:RNA polymerase sigma-70 factor (ECF subfamily)